MEREMTEEQEDQARGGDIGIGDGDSAGTNIPAGSTGAGTSNQSSGRTPNDSAPGITGGYGTGGLDVEEQSESGGA